MGTLELYPNSPLSEIVFEIRFNGDLSIECKRDVFYKKIRDDFSNILVPQAVPGQPIALQPYKFVSEDNSKGIMIAINQFSFYKHKYSGFENFREEYGKLIKAFQEVFEIRNLNRTGLRYINYIPYISESGVVPLENFLNVEVSLSDLLPSNDFAINLELSKILEKGKLNIKIQSVKSLETEEKAINLDFDYYKEKELHIYNISD